MWARVQYRVWQLWQIVTARPLTGAALQEIAAVLSPSENALFQLFSQSDQRHSYRVYCVLRDAGYQDKALLAAALLHDVGKTQVTLHWWDRVFIVLAMVGGKGRTVAWGEGTPDGWRKGLVVKAQHPAWGATMAEAVGSCATTVFLIRHHQDVIVPVAAAAPEKELLRALQWADDQS